MAVLQCAGYDMSPYVRRYAKYLNAKSSSYRQMAYDFCKIKKGSVFNSVSFILYPSFYCNLLALLLDN